MLWYQEMIADIVTFGGGGYGYEEVRRMPIHIRKFIYERLVQQRKKATENSKIVTGENLTLEKMKSVVPVENQNDIYYVHKRKS